MWIYIYITLRIACASIPVCESGVHCSEHYFFFKDTKMLQSAYAYEMWKIIPPPVICLSIFIVYAVYISPCFKCWKTSRQALQQKLATLSLKILFSHESLAEEIKVAEHQLRAKWKSREYQRFATALFSSLPLMLFCIAFAVFWDKFIIYETDHDCDVEDLELECFFNSSGPLSCSAVSDLRIQTYNCYKFSFDLVNGVAAAGGIFTLTLLVNVLLVKCFFCVRYHTTSMGKAAAVQYSALCLSVLVYILWAIRVMSTNVLDGEIFLQATVIYFCSVICCTYPWYRIEPSHSDEDYQWVPSFSCCKTNTYVEITGPSESLAGHADA